jgi:rubrerythrin
VSGPREARPARAQPGAARARLTRREGLRAATAGAVFAVAAAPGAAAASGDAELLAGLLRTERRLAAFYDAALRQGRLPAATARHLRDQEREHAAGLEKALRSVGGRPPSDRLPAPLIPSQGELARLALRLEADAIRAYVGAIANLRSVGLRQPLGSIAASEGQHEVVLREIAGEDPLGSEWSVE